MKKATFLHLSDFHCRKATKHDSSGPFDEFIVDIGEWCDNHKDCQIDSILISGDIAYSGTSYQYTLAEDMINRILEVTEVKNECLFLVPGNHDVNFAKITKPEEETIRSILGKRSKIDDFLKKYNNYKIFLDKFKSYSAFQDRMANSSTSWKKGSNKKLKPWYSVCVTINGIKFRIIGLTTSLLASENEITHGSIHVGKYQIQEVLIPQKRDEFVIMLSHHPIDWFDEDESWALQVLMGKKKAIYLHGHSHHHRSYHTSISPDVEYRSISAGALYSGSHYRHKYHIFQIDSVSKKLRLWPREWKTDGDGWREDSDWRNLDADGSWTTNLSKIVHALPVPKILNPYCLASKQLSFRNFPDILTQTKDKNEKINIAVVIGSGRYLHSDHVSYGTDCLEIPEVIDLLKDWNRNIHVSSHLDIDVYNTKSLQDKNLLIIGSGKVNFVTMKLLERFGNALKFRFTPLYNVIVSNIGRDKMYRDGEREDWGLGIICLTQNPWAAEVQKERVVILIAGFHPLGSIASANLLRRYIENPTVRENNKFDETIPMKIVRGRPIEFNEYHKRISDVIMRPINTPTYIGNIRQVPQIVE